MKYFKFSDQRRRAQVRAATTLVLAAPRILAPLGALAAATTLLAACVPAMRYEEAVSAAQVEAEARRRAEVELSASKGRESALQAELAARDDKLEARDQKLAEAGLSQGKLAKERDETSFVLDQLRSDLARANDNVRSYADRNQRLERELANGAPPAAAGAPPAPAATAAAAPAPAAVVPAATPEEVAGLAAAVETALGVAGLAERVKLVRRSDGLVLSVAERAMFGSGSATPSSDVLRALDVASRWLEARPQLTCRLREVGSAAQVSEALGRERRDKLVRAIEERKLGQRIVYQPSPDSPSAEAYEIVLSLPGAGVPAPTKGLTKTPPSAAPRVDPPSGS